MESVRMAKFRLLVLPNPCVVWMSTEALNCNDTSTLVSGGPGAKHYLSYSTLGASPSCSPLTQTLRPVFLTVSLLQIPVTSLIAEFRAIEFSRGYHAKSHLSSSRYYKDPQDGINNNVRSTEVRIYIYLDRNICFKGREKGIERGGERLQ